MSEGDGTFVLESSEDRYKVYRKFGAEALEPGEVPERTLQAIRHAGAAIIQQFGVPKT